MAAKKDASRYTIKFDPTIPIHQEAMQTLDEAGRSKAALIADAIHIRNALYSRNTNAIAVLLPNVSQQPAPALSQVECMTETATPPLKPKFQDENTIQSEDDFWESMDSTLKMFSV